MALVYLSCRVTFCASHRLHNPALSDEENKNIFGKCNNANGHGHNYVLKVMVRGPIDPKTGMLINLFDLEGIVQEDLLENIDHKYLNLDVPHFREVIPTAENIAIYCWKVLQKKFPKGLLYEIKLHEVESSAVIYRGEEAL